MYPSSVQYTVHFRNMLNKLQGGPYCIKVNKKVHNEGLIMCMEPQDFQLTQSNYKIKVKDICQP